MNYSDWREPTTKAFSCEYQPKDFSCDNGILFSVEAHLLGLIDDIELDNIVLKYETMPGILKRHPSSNDLMAWDDYFGISIASPFMAGRILTMMEANGWKLPNGNWLGRIPIFKPAVRAGAGRTLTIFDQLKVAAVYFTNTFEKPSETSGKMMLYFGRRVFQKHWLTRKATAYWTRKMSKIYAKPRDLVFIYFPSKQGNPHPFVVSAPTDWV